ncbi:hypothetical protein, partial [Frankia sp. AgB32]|uniref:hypothetical protein n=1 Tax=Frankia sp. AgB32 TaxID=631119 RepID=UPI00200F3C14
MSASDSDVGPGPGVRPRPATPFVEPQREAVTDENQQVQQEQPEADPDGGADGAHLNICCRLKPCPRRTEATAEWLISRP